MAALLERFYEVNKGTITIDDVNIQELDASWLRGHAIGFINQVSCHYELNEVHNLVIRPMVSKPKIAHAGQFDTFVTLPTSSSWLSCGVGYLYF